MVLLFFRQRTPISEPYLRSTIHVISRALRLVNQLVTDVQSEEFDEHTMELECVVVQVLQIASTLDLTDEFGRRSLVALVRKWITSQTVPSTLSPPLLKLHAMLEPNLVSQSTNSQFLFCKPPSVA